MLVDGVVVGFNGGEDEANTDVVRVDGVEEVTNVENEPMVEL